MWHERKSLEYDKYLSMEFNLLFFNFRFIMKNWKWLQKVLEAKLWWSRLDDLWKENCSGNKSRKFTLFGLILYLIDDFGKVPFAEDLTLIVCRECGLGGFVDNKSTPVVCESLLWILWEVQDYSYTNPSLLGLSSLPSSFVVQGIH